MALIELEGASSYSNTTGATMRDHFRRRGYQNNNAIHQSGATHPITGGFLEANADTGFGAIATMPDESSNFVWGARWMPVDVTTSLFYQLPKDVIYVSDFNVTQIMLQIGQNGELVLWRGNKSVELDRAAFPMLMQQWYYLEFKATINATTGSYDIRINGTTIMSDTNVNTDPNGSGVFTHFSPRFAANCKFRWADMYLLDSSGSAPWNDFLGDIHIETLRPDGDGNRNDFTPDSGLTNYTQVDEVDPDQDTSYVESSTALDDELYTFEALTGSYSSVYGVQVKVLGRNLDAGQREISALCRSSTSESNSTAFYFNEERHRYLMGLFEQNPNGPANWTDTAVDAAEFGITIDT